MNATVKAERTPPAKMTASMARFGARKVGFWLVALVGLCVGGLHYYRAPLFRLCRLGDLMKEPVKNGCPFPLPNHLLKEQPLRPNEGPLARSIKKLHAFLSKRVSHPDIDSLSIAVVTPTGTLFEWSYGILKANETTSRLPVSRNSIYRIASITKMFTMLETLILRERGVLNLRVLSLSPSFPHS